MARSLGKKVEAFAAFLSQQGCSALTTRLYAGSVNRFLDSDKIMGLRDLSVQTLVTYHSVLSSSTQGVFAAAWKWYVSYSATVGVVLPLLPTAMRKADGHVQPRMPAAPALLTDKVAPALIPFLEEERITPRELANLALGAVTVQEIEGKRTLVIQTLYRTIMMEVKGKAHLGLVAAFKACYPTKSRDISKLPRTTPWLCHPPDSGISVYPGTIANAMRANQIEMAPELGRRMERYTPRDRQQKDEAKEKFLRQASVALSNNSSMETSGTSTAEMESSASASTSVEKTVSELASSEPSEISIESLLDR